MLHHPLSPSKQNAWAVCPCFDGDDKTSEAAERGTAQHEALAALLGDKPLNPADDPDDDEIAGVLWAFDTITKIAGDQNMHVEVELEYIEEGQWEPLYTGTADVFTDSGLLFDLKTGHDHGYLPQMQAYGLALCQKLGVDEVECYILFSRTKTVQHFNIDKEEALASVRAVLAARANPERQPVACHFCKWCAHAADCVALTGIALTVAGGRDDWKLEQYHASEIAKPSEMSKALKMARMIAHWAEAVEHRARELAIKEGVEIPGFRLWTRRGNRAITDPAKALELSGLSPAAFLAACKVGITELEKRMGKKQFAAVMGPVVARAADVAILSENKEE